MIRLASIYDRDRPPTDDGLRVLVMRQWPRGVKRERADLWLRDAAPSRDLLDAYNHGGLGWDEYARRYRSEMLDERADVLERLRDLEREHGTLTLLCKERIPPDAHCHREILAELLNADHEPPLPRTISAD
jgi:uncharacterized protein YeaO (DUF488 family)